MTNDIWTFDKILFELNKSNRWGVNDQPVDPGLVANVIVELPILSVNMKKQDTLILKFTRPLSEDEANKLRRAVDLDPEHEDDPFPDGPKLEALCWWD